VPDSHDPAKDPTPPEPGLTHLDARGRASMVDVGEKPPTARVAVAEATVRLDPAVRTLLWRGELPKGEALAVARVAGIQAAKETSRLIPLCHPLALSRVAVEFEPVGDDRIQVLAECRTVGPTGVEMEALCAASVAALTIYDMVKGRCRGASIETVQLRHKSGGKSGTWERATPGGGA
jgi:cyclic pyranopterin phosphate synthase